MTIIEKNQVLDDTLEFKRQQEELKLYFYRVIHDIKSPICSMVSLIRLTKSKIKDKESQGFLNEIENCFNLLNIEISSSLRNEIVFSETISSTPLNLETVLFEVINILTFSRNLSNVKIHPIVIQTKDFRINRQLLFSILQNILDNAIKHGRNSESDRLNIYINITQLDGYIRIEATDDGIGMTEKTKLSLFEKFNTDESILTKGSGLGLYLIKKSVEKLNGQIFIDSDKNKGTRFEILIPEL
jgi:signal transduction histidine kinase